MGRIFRNLREIPVPSFAYVNAADARVFTMHRDEFHRRQRVTIGQATSKTTMHPNENFKFFYPGLWKEFYGGEKIEPHELHAGLYGLLLACAWRTGLYPMMQNDFGPANTNAVLDCVMYGVRFRANPTVLMKDGLADQLTFSDKFKSDSWHSDFFENQLTADSIHRFRTDWAKHCAERGSHEAWLCIDGPNNDCSDSESTLAEPGHAKSPKAVDIYSCMWAVGSRDGRPITWFLNNGGKVDAKAFEKMTSFLKAAGISVRGVILDRGFATAEVLSLIRTLGYHYVVMLKPSSSGYKTMIGKYAEAVRWHIPNAINEKGIFAATARTRVFAKSGEEACIALFYDADRAVRKGIEDLGEAFGALREVQAQIHAGRPRSRLRIPEKTGKFLEVKGTEEAPRVELCSDELARTVKGRGFSAIASSENLTAREIGEIYDFRDVSEKQFRVLKSQLAPAVTRVRDDLRIHAKLAISFIAAVLRTEIELACRKLGLDINQALRETDQTVLTFMPNGKYSAVHEDSEPMKELYAQFGLTNEHPEFFAQEINNRRNPMHSQTREMPPFLEPKPKRRPGRPPKPKTEEAAEAPKRRPGRPKGSKNKKTLEREALEANQPPKPKRGPGRPKGSRNKKTLEKEALAAAPKRGRGRPKGSKNKKTLERARLAAESRQPSP